MAKAIMSNFNCADIERGENLGLGLQPGKDLITKDVWKKEREREREKTKSSLTQQLSDLWVYEDRNEDKGPENTDNGGVLSVTEPLKEQRNNAAFKLHFI